MTEHKLSHCPGCGSSWFFESQEHGECVYCGYKPRYSFLAFMMYFVPYIMFVLIGLGILKALGRNYHGW